MKYFIKGITFDFMNTIAKVKISPAHQYYKLAKRYGIRISEDAIKKSYRSVWLDLKILYPNYGQKEGMSSKLWWHIFAHRLFKINGFEGQEEDILELTDHLYTEFTKAYIWEIADNLVKTLTQLKKADIKLMVVSNYDDRLTELLKSLQLNYYFDAVITSFESGFEKPDKRIYKLAIKQMDLSPKYILHIGDDYLEDFVAAKSAGLKSLLYVPQNTNNINSTINYSHEKIENFVDIFKFIK